MPVIIELPNSATALLKSSDELSNRDVKLLRRAGGRVNAVIQKLKENGIDVTAIKTDDDAEATEEANQRGLSIIASLSDDEADNMDLFQRECAAIRLIEWSLDLPLPKTADDVDNLPRPVYTALTTEAIKLDLNENFDKTPETLLDPPVATPESDA